MRIDVARVRLEQRRELAGVRRQHGRRVAFERLELPERVRVEHDGPVEPLEQDADEIDGPVAAAQAGPDRDRVRALRCFEHRVGRAREQASRAVLRQRPLHRLEQSRF